MSLPRDPPGISPPPSDPPQQPALRARQVGVLLRRDAPPAAGATPPPASERHADPRRRRVLADQRRRAGALRSGGLEGDEAEFAGGAATPSASGGVLRGPRSSDEGLLRLPSELQRRVGAGHLQARENLHRGLPGDRPRAGSMARAEGRHPRRPPRYRLVALPSGGGRSRGRA